jgi:hypothetical protein
LALGEPVVAVAVVGIVGMDAAAAMVGTLAADTAAAVAADESEVDHNVAAGVLVVLVAVVPVESLGVGEEALISRSHVLFDVRQESSDSQDCQSRMTDEGSLVRVLVDVASVLGLLDLWRSCPGDSEHTAVPEPVAASLVAYHICFFVAVDTVVVTGVVGVGEVVAEAVASIYRVVLGAWIGSAHVASAASGEALVLDSMERAKAMRLECYVPSVAILLEVVVLAGELA